MIFASISVLFAIFLINIIPAFMPPTWMVLSFVGFNFDLNNYSLIALSIFAAFASTSGRVVLALLSKKIIRNKILNEASVKNIDSLKKHLEKRKVFTWGFFLLFAFSPLPSGQLFLAYGLTNLRIRMAAIPFFIGRVFSYFFWIFSASKVSEKMDLQTMSSEVFFSLSFILAQIITFYLVYLFIKIDWDILFKEHRIKLVKKIVS